LLETLLPRQESLRVHIFVVLHLASLLNTKSSASMQNIGHKVCSENSQ
jgi:hypothetical protein